MNGRKTKEQKLQKRKRRLEAAFDICSANDHITTVSELAEYLGLSDRSIRNSIDEHEGFTRENGIVYRDKRG